MSSQLLGFWLTFIGLGFLTVATDSGVSPNISVLLLFAGLAVLFGPFIGKGKKEGSIHLPISPKWKVGDWCTYKNIDVCVIIKVYLVIHLLSATLNSLFQFFIF